MIRIPLSYNSIDTKALSEVLERYQENHHNQLIYDFETQLATTVGAKYAVALNSGTAAIHLALLVLDVKPDDMVIAPTFTYVATVNPILYVGANPVLVDAENHTWNMDPELLEKALKELSLVGKLPKAIMVVHTYGTPAFLKEIITLANRYEIPVIEDAAESLGASIEGKAVGTWGALGVYSFNNNKSVTTFGGGALVTDNPDFARKARFFAAQSREDFPYYEHRKIGFNYAINPLAAAYGLSQLTDLQKFTTIRKNIFNRYRELLPVAVTTQQEGTGVSSSRWLSAFLIPEGGKTDTVAITLRELGIETRPLWKPMHQQPLLGQIQTYQNGNSDNFFKRGICLPSGNNLEEATQQEVISVVSSLW